MDIVLQPVLWKKAIVYIDDINIYSETFEQYIKDIQKVFNLIKNANLIINPEKCHFCTNEMQFLGHIVGIEEIKPDLQKNQLQQNVFDWLKQCLTQSPILQYPDYFEPFILFTDTSYQGLGTVLSQIKNDREHVIAYASRTLTLAEQNYSTVKLECLA
ncbi:10557_t:CDS:2, partial [Gigaspora rosea]